MKAIFKNQNVYVIVNVEDDVFNNNDIVLSNIVYPCPQDSFSEIILYGGRIIVYGYRDRSNFSFSVDGISLKRFSTARGKYYIDGDYCWEITDIAAFLNQVENLGIDTFIENYRNQLQAMKEELKTESEKLEQELSARFDEDKSSILDSIRATIRELGCIIFLCLIHMNAGLENHLYTEACDAVVGMFGAY